MGQALNLAGPDYQIGPNLGQQRGANLFHSFQYFNLNRLESATFSGPNHIQNVMSRVTGGNPSSINGTIRSMIPNADMYFINPDGIVFGPHAQLDVPGSFHASTADYLGLGEGGRFDSKEPNNTFLTIAPVEAFGFLNSSIAPISIEGGGEIASESNATGLSVLNGKNLSLIGGQLEIKKGTFFKTEINQNGQLKENIRFLSTLYAPEGRINLASVASKGEVKLGDDFVEFSSFSELANIHISENSLLQVNGKGSGSIFIRSGELFVSDSRIEANTLISLLFYLGLVTIHGLDGAQFQFFFPNDVVKELYWAFFIKSLKSQYQLDFPIVDVHHKIKPLAQDNDVKPFVALIETALKTLSNRDFISFYEKSIKALFVGFASLSNLYFIKSEPELEQKYPDILFLYRPPFFPEHQFLFELKSLKKTQRQKLKSIRLEAINQIKTYLDFEEMKQLDNLKSWVIVFVGDQMKVVEEVL